MTNSWKEKISDTAEQLSEIEVGERFSFNGLFAIGLLFVLGIAFFLRYMPAQGMKYLQALDPYMIFRMSQHVALEGNYPAVDFMRYFPYNTPTYLLNQGNILIPSVLYWFGPALFLNYLGWAQIYPALMGTTGILLTYFLGKEIFDRYTGLSAAFFLAVIPGVLHRTSAGFFEKEPIGTTLMLFTLYFFTRSWKREEWLPAIGAGFSLALFTISWGGSKMMWILLPLIVGSMLWLNEDIKQLIVAYTPTVILGIGLGMVLNPSRVWPTNSLLLLNLGLLAFLWSRYLAEQLEILNERQLSFYTPVVSILGFIVLALSPLYSDFLASKFMAVINTVFGDRATATIAQTVAENTPATFSQLASSLIGGSTAAQVDQYFSGIIGIILGPLSNVMGSSALFLGALPLAFAGISILGASITAMLLRKFDLYGKEILKTDYYKLIPAIFLGWAVLFAFFANIGGSGMMMILGPASIIVIGSVLIRYYFLEANNKLDQKIEIEYKWYYIIPFLWAVTNIIGAMSLSRLVFLSSFSTAFMAGFAISKGYKAFSEISFSSQSIKYALITIIGVLLLLTNISAGYVQTSNLSGSPSQFWDTSLDYMESETPEGSVIMSWWDYGYWFESIGRRAAIADGGNAGYYTSNKKVNFPLADFLTSPPNTEKHTEFLEKHSVDYIVLDETMIGKYAAVSTIANEGDQDKIQQMSQISTSRNIQNSLVQQNNQTIIQFRNRQLTLYTPINSSTSGVEISSPPIIETSRGRSQANCVLTDSGKKRFNESQESPFCVALNPFYSVERALQTAQIPNVRSTPARAVLVPEEISDSALVRLYLMDGYGIDYVEKVQDGSNGYVKMWKVKGLEE